VVVQNQFIRPFDFINMLGNTTSYYVASSLGVKGKNIFQISDNFTFINSLISIYASLNDSKKNAILGSIDLVGNSELMIKQLLAVEENRVVIDSASYQKFSLSKEDSIAELEFDINCYTLNEIRVYLEKIETKVIFSSRCENIDLDETISFSETIISSIINQHIQDGIDLIYIDCFDKRYKILQLNLSTTIIR
jgi:hypothetical protein